MRSAIEPIADVEEVFMYQIKQREDAHDSRGATPQGKIAGPGIVAPLGSPNDSARLPERGSYADKSSVEGVLTKCDALGVKCKERHLNVTTGRELPDEGLRDKVESFEFRAEEIKKLVSSVPNLQVKELPSRPLTGGPLARLWNQTILSKWWRDAFPVFAFDVYKDNGRSLTKLYRVTLSSKLLSTDIDPSVDHYRSGGELAKDAADEMRQKLDALAKNDTTADVRQKGGVSQEGSTDRGVSITGASKAKSLVGALEAQELMLSKEAERLGLPRNASTDDISSLKALAALMKRDVLKLVSDIEVGSSSLSKRSDGRTVVSTKSYKLPSGDFWGRYRSKDKLLGLLGILGGAFGLPINVVGSLFSYGASSIIPISLTLATTCLGAVGLAIGYTSQNRVLTRLFESREPGSLGEAIQPIKNAGLDFKASTNGAHLKLTISKKKSP
jgi:hypothetical protein